MKFSIIHASARPTEWEKSAKAYYDNASGKHEIEYILVTEPGVTFFDNTNLDYSEDGLDPIILDGITPKSSVSHWNLGAAKATGDIIILNSDDMFPPKDWDEKLANLNFHIHLTDPHKEDWITLEEWLKLDISKREAVVRVGYKEEAQKGLITLQIMTKAYHDRFGYAMYPGFQSVYADDDFTACAEELGPIIEAPNIVWEHRHPIYTGKKLDEVYKVENEDIRYKYGRALFNFRKSLGYKAILGLGEPKKPTGKIVALCTPGKEFASDFVFEFGQLIVECFVNGGVIHAPSTSCNIHTARSECLLATESVGLKYDYLFWVDSDQLEYLTAFKQLMKRMEDNPQMDVISGWTYMQHDANINVGYFGRQENDDLEILNDGMFKTRNVTKQQDFVNDNPFRVDWIGFACVLMKRSVVERLVPDIFSPLYVYQGKNHWVSEDMGFCLKALEKGIDIYVDPLAYVKHMKLQEVLPALKH